MAITYNSPQFITVDTEAERDTTWADGTRVQCKDTNKLYVLNAGVFYVVSGLTNVDNTSDADKPVSTSQQTALDLKEDEANKGAANGYAPLGADSLVPLVNLPTLGVGDVVGPIISGADKVVLFDGITGKLIKDSGLTLAGTNTGDQTLPVKATGAEINTGTDDAKFATAKAITDSNVAFLADIPAAVNDATIATTDITTNNASTSKHGWFQKFPTPTGLYFKDDGTWGTPTAAAANQNPNLLVQGADYNLLANYGMVVPGLYEISNTFVLDIAADAVLEIT